MLVAFREREMAGEREGEKYWCERNIDLLPFACTPTRDWTRNLGMCPDGESNPWLLFTGWRSTWATRPGHFFLSVICWDVRFVSLLHELSWNASSPCCLVPSDGSQLFLCHAILEGRYPHARPAHTVCWTLCQQMVDYCFPHGFYQMIHEVDLHLLFSCPERILEKDVILEN